VDIQILVDEKDGEQPKKTETFLVGDRKGCWIVRGINSQDQRFEGWAVALPQRLAQNGTFRRSGRIITVFSQAATEEHVPIIAQQSGSDGIRKAGIKLPSLFAGMKGGLDKVFERY